MPQYILANVFFRIVIITAGREIGSAAFMIGKGVTIDILQHFATNRVCQYGMFVASQTVGQTSPNSMPWLANSELINKYIHLPPEVAFGTRDESFFIYCFIKKVLGF